MTKPIAFLSKLTDGNFHVPRPESPLPFTGERMTSDVEGQIEFEHYHRYCLARDVCSGLDVLDVASGEGYGTALLAGVARSVIGVEIDASSVAHARKQYAMPNLVFQRGDALALPVEDDAVDVVVSFETLEHVTDQEAFLREVRRVLRPGGLFVVSTPDRLVYSAPGSDPNPHHVRELTPPELSELIGSFFVNYKILYQRPLLGSVIATTENALWRSYERRSLERLEASNGLARSHYLLAVASDAELPAVGSSVYADRRRVHDVVQDAISAASLRNVCDNLRIELSTRLAETEKARSKSEERLLELERQLDAEQGAFQELKTRSFVAVRDLMLGGFSLTDTFVDGFGREDWVRIVSDILAAREMSIPGISIRDWGARVTSAGTAVNRQPDGSSAMWFEGPRLGQLEGLRVSFGPHLTKPVHRARADLVTSEIPASVIQTPGRYPVFLVDQHARFAYVGMFSVRVPGLWPNARARGLKVIAAVAAPLSPSIARWLRGDSSGSNSSLWSKKDEEQLQPPAPSTAGHEPVPTTLARSLSYTSSVTGLSSRLSQPNTPSLVEQAFDVSRRLVPAAHDALRTLVQSKRDLRSEFGQHLGAFEPVFPKVTNPVVSVIIPVYRGLDDLETCLRSIAATIATEPSFEVILVDDCPEDPVMQAIPESAGLHKLANERNMGFLISCRRGAELARGRVFCFLNSDTIVMENWLRSLVEALDDTPNTALAGSMLLNVDGTIQDAGWRIMSDGWGHPIGRNGSAGDGAYTYRRQVDCVTGASFCISRKHWLELDGFDLVYAPAFYEEFDLAFRAKQRGLVTLYEPKSRVVHLGSASYGAERRDQLSAINHSTFVARFSQQLQKQPWDKSDEFVLCNAGPLRPVILVIDYGVPDPRKHAGDVTLTGYLRLLVESGWRVIYGPNDGKAEGFPGEQLERLGIEMIRGPQTIKRWLQEHGRHLTYVWVSRPEIAKDLIPDLRKTTSAPILYYTHDLHHLRMEREAELRNDERLRREAAAMRSIEIAVLSDVDHIMTPSSEEGDIIARLVPGRHVSALPPYFFEASEITCRDASAFAPLSDILFVGGFPHTPNVDAALFIAHEIMPIVWQAHPETRLLLVGYAPPPEVQALAGSRIIVTGQVTELRPWFDRARLLLAALRYGAGVKGKVVEAMRNGVPVVTTAIGAEGLGITQGKEALVAGNAEELAAAVIKLLGSPEACEELSKTGAALVSRRFSRRVARETVETILHIHRCTVCGSTRTPPREQRSSRESFVCHDCFALARTEAVARLVLERLAKDGERSLAELGRRQISTRIHELGFAGAISEVLQGYPNFSNSEYFPDVPLGASGPAGIRCEDVTRLTYADESFDLVISQDVMEHVADPLAGFREVARVLRPGGSHFFTVPQNVALERSVTRARLKSDGSVEHVLPPEYHGDPVRAEGALVFTEYGRDLPLLLASVGLGLKAHRLAPLNGREGDQITVFEASRTASTRDKISC